MSFGGSGTLHILFVNTQKCTFENNATNKNGNRHTNTQLRTPRKIKGQSIMALATVEAVAV